MSSGSAAGHDGGADNPAQRWRALALGLVAAFMTLLDVSIVNVAIPSIQTGLDLLPSELQWVLSGYALTFGLVLIPAGRFGDAHGRRDAFIAGLALFTLASAAAGLSRGALWLVLARLVQGAAAGMVNPQVSGLIQQLFSPAERGRPFGLFGAIIGVSTAVGPLLGGTLIELGGTQEGWRWVFYLNIPVGVAVIILARRWMPGHPVGRQRSESVDPVGIILLGTGVVLLLLPLVQERQWHGMAKWLLVPAAAGVLAVFVWWQRRRAGRGAGLIDLGLFRHRSFALGTLLGLLYFSGFTAIFFIFTLFLQNGLHYTALGAGIAITPFALGSATAATLGGRVVTRYGRPLVAAGLGLVFIGLGLTMVALHFVPGHQAPFATAAPLLVAGLGSGLVIAPNQTLSLAEIPVEEAGSAGGVLQTGQRIGAAVGIAAVGSIFFAELSSSGQDWTQAFRSGLLVLMAFVLMSLAVAVADIAIGRRQRARRAGADRS